MNPTKSHSAATPPKPSPWVVFATVMLALLTTGSAFAYMWTQERPPSAKPGYSSAKANTGETPAPTP